MASYWEIRDRSVLNKKSSGRGCWVNIEPSLWVLNWYLDWLTWVWYWLLTSIDELSTIAVGWLYDMMFDVIRCPVI